MSVLKVNAQPHFIGGFEDLSLMGASGILKGAISTNGTITLKGGFNGRSLIINQTVSELVPGLIMAGVSSVLFVVSPRTKCGFVKSFEVNDVWKPSILDPGSGESDDRPEEFCIRGEVIRVGRNHMRGRYVAVRVLRSYYVSVDLLPLSIFLNEGDFVEITATLSQYNRLRANYVWVLNSSNFTSSSQNSRQYQQHRRHKVRR
jgi:hypothetical protein